MAKIEEAFRAIDRKQFVLPEYKDLAQQDIPLPIGHDQTISQPTTVQRMLQWLDPDEGHTVLDVGSGSGWTSALLGYIVGPEGKVHAVERIPELIEFGRGNVQGFGLSNVVFHQAGNIFGLPEHAPYDRILVSAASEDVPPELIDQMATGGRLVIPVKSEIRVITKHAKDRIDTEVHKGYMFVPLLK